MKLTEVIPQLYIRQHTKKIGYERKLKALRAKNVTLVLRLCRQPDLDFPLEGITNYYIPIVDSRKDINFKAFKQINELSVTAISKGRGVLIHCIAGRNRSALACALVMREITGCSGEEAYQRIKTIRPGTFSNYLFKQYLRSLKQP